MDVKFYGPFLGNKDTSAVVSFVFWGATMFFAGRLSGNRRLLHAGSNSHAHTPTLGGAAISGVLKWKGDLTGKGLFDQETVLAPANVNVATFGKRGSFATDGLIIAQPLFVSNLDMGAAGVHNVVIAVNEHDSVFAFDVDHPGTPPLWARNYTDPANGITTGG